jgi:hypothetical protein
VAGDSIAVAFSPACNLELCAVDGRTIPGDLAGYTAFASVNVLVPGVLLNDYVEMLLIAGARASAHTCDCVWTSHWARAEVPEYWFSSTGNWEVLYIVEVNTWQGCPSPELGSTNQAPEGRTEVAVAGRILREGALLSAGSGPPTFLGRFVNGPYSKLCGVSDNGFGHVSGSLQDAGGLGAVSLGARTVAFVDTGLDASGDGRFNALDIAALESYYGQAHPQWDFDHDGVVDSGDRAYLELLVNVQLDSGLIGDVNRDGVLDCADWAQMSPFPSATLGQVDYRITLDVDLDGDNDTGDGAAVLAVWGGDCDADGVPDACQPCAGDMNCDGIVSFGDMDLLINSFAYPGCIGWPECCPCSRGDLNGDGVNNFFDIDPFVARIGATCP